MKAAIALLAALALAGCGQNAANNSVNAANVAAEEGVQDLNAAIGGDELEPIPEADDDLAGNQARPPANTAAPRP